MKILSNESYRAEIQAAKDQTSAEIKGYYQAREKELNDYLQIVAREIHNQVQLPVMSHIDRHSIAQLYKTNGVLKGIVDYIAKCVGDMFTYLELTDRKSGEVVQEPTVSGILTRPNDRYTLRMVGEGAAVNYLLFGDQWNYLPIKVGKDFGKRELYIIPSHRVGVKTGDYERLFEGIKLAGSISNKVIESKDVFEVFDYNIDDDSFFGMSKVESAALYLSVLERGMQRQEVALKNGGPANIITPAASTNYPALREDVDNAEQKLNSGKNINKNLFEPIPIDVHQLGNRPVDLDILTSHKEAVTALCFVYGLPVDLYYGQSKYENAREAKKQVYEQTAIPFANKWAESLLSFLGLSDRYELSVNTDNIDILHADPYAVAKDLSSVGAFTTNEIRKAVGFETIDEDWADEVRLPMGVQIGNEPIDIIE